MDHPRGRTAALVAASILLHACALGWMSWQALGLDDRYARPAEDTLILIEIEPRPLLRGERPRPPAAAPTAAPAPTAPSQRTSARPAPPAPRLVEPAPNIPTPDDPWRVRPDQVPGGMVDGVGRALRGGVGCRQSYDRLSAAEQAACDQRTVAAADRAAPVTGSGDARRDARFNAQGARALAEYEARRRPLSGGTGVLTAADCPGSNFGTGCAGAFLPDVPGVDMRQGATTVHNGGQRSDKQQTP
ncbi:MAG: hypothetical protein EON91_12885 [Brevundimonas sp.]|uniref:hypothetical protein n=1 Tax=Brevundimonas sp. TaxID=1871086 RepID=UPI00121D9BE1|nr:hypothetical protein [Brevundimonas sp.]RZJ16538.1 MAG: hypothetical protein EON91_12885 [Brevundimonas sp.]